MITLSPGPSQLSEETKDDIRKAIDDGVLELSHRSKKFTDISGRCIESIRTYLEIPSDYHVFYLDSATQAWHSLVANLVIENSFHFINGSFSSKAREASKLLGKNVLSSEATWGMQNDFANVKIRKEVELITTCFNETSTGVKMLSEEVRSLREKNPDTMLAVDVTSCAGGFPLSFLDADAWYFSVQKCFGLPAGLGILILSPRAYKRSIELTEKKVNLAGIWAWEKLEETMRDGVYQTPQTPNVLNIYLLAMQCERWNKDGGLQKRYEAIVNKRKMFDEWIRSQKAFSFFVKDESHRSDTVLVVESTPELITSAKLACKEKGIELGSGYGKIKSNTFRIANFPAVTEKQLKQTFSVLGGA